jgi:uncharacterized membrane protein
MKGRNLPALGLAAFIGGAGVAHFVKPEFFDAIVPDWMPGSKRTVTLVSGAVELAGAALVAVPRTRRLGAWWCLATFVGVFPANIQSALNGGIADAPPPFNTKAAAWGRLPLQAPMILWARSVARSATAGRTHP